MIEEIKMYQAVCDRCGYVCDEDEGEIEIRDTPDGTAVFTKKEDAKKYADGVFKRWGADSDTCIYESNIDDPETLKMIRKEDEK